MKTILLLLGVACVPSFAAGLHFSSGLPFDAAIPRHSPVILNGAPDKNIPEVISITTRRATNVGGCSATIVGANTLLTAAHCIEGGISMSVDSHVSTTTSTRTLRCVPQPQYATTKGDNEKARLDLAVCQLVSGNFRTPPARVSQYVAGTQMYYTGYGCTGVDSGGAKSGFRSTIPDTAKATLISPSATGATFSAQYKTGNSDYGGTCSGDSGGALGHRDGEEYQLVAVHSNSDIFNENIDKTTKKGLGTYTINDRGVAESVNLFSTASQDFLKAQVAAGFVINGIVGPPAPPTKNPTPSTSPTATIVSGEPAPPTKSPTATPTPAPIQAPSPYGTPIVYARDVGGTAEYYPSGPNTGLRVEKDAQGNITGYSTYHGDVRGRATLSRLSGPPPGFVVPGNPAGSSPIPAPSITPAPVYGAPSGIVTGNPRPRQATYVYRTESGGTSEYYPETSRTGIIVSKDASGNIIGYYSYQGDPRVSVRFQRLGGPPPGF